MIARNRRPSHRCGEPERRGSSVRSSVALCAALVMLWLGAVAAQAAACPPLVLGGAPAVSSIDAAADADCFTFTGAVGDDIRVRVIKTSGSLDPLADVIRPTQTTRCSTYADEFTCTLDAAGSHTLAVRDYYGTGVGTYSVYAQRLDKPVGCAAIAFGAAPTAASITVAAETDCFTFTGAVGDDIRLRVIKASGSLDPLVDVVRPAGTTRCSTYADEFTCTVDVAGSHTILVRDYYGTGVGGYSVSVQRLDKPVGCLPLSFGAAPKVGSIVAAAEGDCFTFAAAVGDDIRLRVIKTSGSLDPLADVVRPDGTVRCSTYADEFTCALDVPGTHTLLVRDYYGMRTGSYSLYIERLDKPVGCATLALGAAPTAGSITAAAEVDCFIFPGAVGDDIRLRVIKTAGSLDPLVDVVRPDGSTRCSSYADEFPCALDVAGAHTLLVRDYYGTGIGNYSLSIQRLDAPLGCAAIAFGATPTAASITAAAAADCFTFTGAVGDDIRVRLIKTSGSLDPLVDVVRPDGTTRCSTYADEFTCTIDAAGPHTLLVRDYYGAGTGGYSLYVQRLDNPVGCIGVEFGAAPTAGSIVAAAEVDCFVFAGAAGDDIRVRVIKTSGSLDPLVDIVRADGTTRCSTYADEFTCTLDVTGLYTILVRDYYGGGTGAYSLYVERLDNPLGCTAISFGAAPSTGSIDVAAEADCFVFAGIAGDNVRLRVITTSGALDPLADVVRPDGTTRCSTYADEFTCLLDADGPHAILVRDYYGGGTGTYSVSIDHPGQPPANDPPDGLGTPAIEFTFVPPYGSVLNLTGQTRHVAPADFKIAVYIRVGSGWWTKPYWSDPATPVAADGTWSCDITTGGIDEQANTIVAYLVPISFSPPLASGQPSLPAELDASAVAKVQVTRTP